jgi:hypothetical protein
MRIRCEQLRVLIRTAILEADETREVVLSDGETVEHNSSEHVRDMEIVLSGLEALKRQHKYGTADRASFANAAARVKRLIKRAGVQEVEKPQQELLPDRAVTEPDRT